MVDQGEPTRTVAENTKAGQAIGDPVVAEDKDGDVLTYTLGGTDAGVFAIDWATGQLKTKARWTAMMVSATSYTVTVGRRTRRAYPMAPGDAAEMANSVQRRSS